MASWPGVVGVVLMVAAGTVRWRWGRGRLGVVAYVMACAGWALVAQFVLGPLVPAPVTAAILLGGITVGILAAAVLGTRRARRADGSGPRVTSSGGPRPRRRPRGRGR